MKIMKFARLSWRYARVLILALLTPLFEKNPSKMKTLSRCQVPMVLSMARVIVLLFAAVMLRQIRDAGVAGWPEATLSIAIVLAIPLLSALERIKPEKAIGFMQSVFRRVGEGSTRTMGSVYASEPSKYDDHSEDEEAEPPQPRGYRPSWLKRAA